MTSKYSHLPKHMIKKVLYLEAPKPEKLALLDYLRNEYLRNTAQYSFASFCEAVMKDEKDIDVKTGMGEGVILQDFHREWCKQLEDNDRLIVFSPRETGKSFIFSVAYTLWRLGTDSNLRIAVISSASHQSKRILSTIKQYIMVDPDLRHVFPKLKPMMDEINTNKPKKWTVDSMLVDRPLASKDVSVVSYGIGSKSILGSRFDLVLLDDVLGQHNTSTQSEIDKVIEWYTNTLEKCLVETGQIVCVGTAWKSNDLMHYLEKKTGWKCFKYSFDKEDIEDNYRWVEWPERHSRKKLDDEKTNDIVSYNRNRRCRTSSTEERPFEENFNSVALRDYDIDFVREKCRKFMGVDLSTKKRKGTAITVIAVDDDRNYVIDVAVGAWKISEKVDKIRQYYDIYQPELIYVENNALQDDIVDALNASAGPSLPIKPFTTGVAKHSSLDRMAIEMENSRWRFHFPSRSHKVLDGSGIADSDWSRFLLEVKMYPDYPNNDMLMSWMFASEAAKKSYGASLQFKLINLMNDDDDFAIFDKLDKSANPFTFKDYTPDNSISRTAGFEFKPSYHQIMNYIKNNLTPDFQTDKISELPLDASEEEFKLVFNDMVNFHQIMNHK